MAASIVPLARSIRILPDGSISRSVVIADMGDDELRQMAEAVERADTMAGFGIALAMAGMSANDFVSLHPDDVAIVEAVVIDRIARARARARTAAEATP